jgi:hypothetical protein
MEPNVKRKEIQPNPTLNEKKIYHHSIFVQYKKSSINLFSLCFGQPICW